MAIFETANSVTGSTTDHNGMHFNPPHFFTTRGMGFTFHKVTYKLNCNYLLSILMQNQQLIDVIGIHTYVNIRLHHIVRRIESYASEFYILLFLFLVVNEFSFFPKSNTLHI